MLSKKTRDLTGERFGRLVVIKFDRYEKRGSGSGRAMWLCECDCGKIKSINAYHLTKELTKSCGCLQREITTKHGESAWKGPGKKEWRAWVGMLGRCNRPSDKRYHDYGGRGISVCPQWHDYSTFLADVGRAPTPEHSLDRINVNGNYEPGNVCWSTRKHQALNRRNSTQRDVGNTSGVLSFGARY